MIMRRLGALFYDSLLILALLIIWTALLLFFTKGQTIPPTYWYRLSLVLVTACYFIGFWHHGGQTSGMKAWRLKLVLNTNLNTQNNNQAISYQRALIRFFMAMPCLLLFGLGFLWLLGNKDRMTLYDRLSRTKLESL